MSPEDPRTQDAHLGWVQVRGKWLRWWLRRLWLLQQLLLVVRNPFLSKIKGVSAKMADTPLFV
jgi:hypothetical protein